MKHLNNTSFLYHWHLPHRLGFCGGRQPDPRFCFWLQCDPAIPLLGIRLKEIMKPMSPEKFVPEHNYSE